MRKLLTILFAVLSFVSIAQAEVEFVAQIPNSTNVPNVSATGCDLCHRSSSGGDARNIFGIDAGRFHRGRTVDWASLCELDSDQDGFTNGQELGDPNCMWQTGQENPTAEITNPADPESFPAEMTEAGMEMTEAGMEMTEAGMEMTEAGMEMTEAGMEMTEAGMEMTEVTNDDSGCDTHQATRSFWSLMLLLSAILLLKRKNIA